MCPTKICKKGKFLVVYCIFHFIALLHCIGSSDKMTGVAFVIINGKCLNERWIVWHDRFGHLKFKTSNLLMCAVCNAIKMTAKISYKL